MGAVTQSCFLQDPEQLQENANQILTAIIQGMRKEEPSNNVKLAATNALLNSLEFTKANFDKEVHTHTQIQCLHSWVNSLEALKRDLENEFVSCCSSRESAGF